MKRFLLSVALSLLGLLAPASARAQFIGYTSPQSVQLTALNAVSTPQTATVPNLGQNVHLLSYTTAGGPLVRMRLEASNDGIIFFAISPDIGGTPSGFVYATGYFSIVRVNLLTYIGAGSVTVNYSGTSSTVPQGGGVFNPSLANQILPFVRLAANTNQTSTNSSVPFGSTRGTLLFTATGVLPAGTCTLQVSPVVFDTIYNPTALLFTLTTVSTQTIQVPDFPATTVSLTFTNCGATATLFSVSYIFSSPGFGTAIAAPQVQGAAADAAAVTGNPVLVGALAGANASTLRTCSTFKTVSATAAGNTALWTPAGGKKFRLMRYIVEVTSNANLAAGAVEVISMQDSAADIAQTHSVWIPTASVTTAAPPLLVSGWIDLGNGILSAAANNVLNVNLGTALATGVARVTACGTEE